MQHNRMPSGQPTAPAGERFPVEVSAYKLFPPPAYAGAIYRQGILDRVLRDDCEPVAVLQGPAGSGKSTTLQQIRQACEARRWPTAWLTFDEADNDPRRFEAHLHALMATLLEHKPASATPDAGSSGAGPDLSDWMLDRLSRHDGPVAIFLDEFQTIKAEAVLRFFRSLLGRLPAQVRLFIGSRTLPEVGLATLLVNRLALVLRADDLRFSPNEAAQFFAAHAALGLRADEVDAIYQRTEGWPAGLQLYKLALANPEVRTSLEGLGSDGPRELAEYLTDNVVSLQSPHIRDFLLRTSLLRRLCAPLCDAVTGFNDSHEVLAQLDASGLFLRPIDAGNRWFKYHGLFASFLTDSLRKTSEQQVAQVHQRAALWYVDHGFHEEAVFHALQAREYQLAADTLNRWSSRLIASAELVTVERWYEALPFDEVAHHLDLAIKAAYALIFLRRRDKLYPLIDMLSQHRGRGDIGATTNPDLVLAMAAAVFEDDLHGAAMLVDKLEIRHRADGGFPAFELGAAANVLAFGKIAAGEFEPARKLLALARSHNDRGGAAFSGGYTTALGGINLLVQGRLQEALEHFRAGMAEPQAQLDKSMASAALAACHLWGLYEAGDLSAMESLAADYQGAIAESAIPDFIGIAHVVISRMHQARGRAGKATETIEQLDRIGHDSRWPRLMQLADWERVRRGLAEGELHRARAIAERISASITTAPPGWTLLSEDVEGEGLGRFRLAIHCGDLAAASRAYAAEARWQPGRVYRQVKLLVLDALLQHRKGLFNAAHRSLRKALALARPGGLVRSILDEGDLVLEMLRQEYQLLLEQPDEPIVSDGDARAYVERLLAASGIDLGRPVARLLEKAQPVETLSGRELEILLFLCNGVSNKEIASRLFVSENTVKFHLKNIYSKLSVGNRSQAINAARALRLVE